MNDKINEKEAQYENWLKRTGTIKAWNTKNINLDSVKQQEWKGVDRNARY